MINCSSVPGVIHNTSFADALAVARTVDGVGYTSYYAISDAPSNIPTGFLVYARRNALGTQTSLLAYYSNKMAIGMMSSEGNISWKDITV